MRTLTILLTLLLFSVVLTNCKEKDDDVFHAVITGVLMDSCGGKVLAGEVVELWDEGRPSDLFRDEIRPFLIKSVTTNSAGKFQVDLDQLMTRNVGTVRYNNQVIMSGEMLEGTSTEQDLGVVFTHPLKKRVRFKFTKGSDFKPNDRIALYQPHSQGTHRDTFINLTGEKKGVLYFEADAYFSIKAFYDIATDSIVHEGMARFFYLGSNDSKTEFLKSTLCDTSLQEFHVNF